MQLQPPTLPPAALEHLARGRKIEAIKATRLATGLGLKEAKELVDAQGRPALSPRASSLERSGSPGLLGLLAALVVGAALAAILLTR